MVNESSVTQSQVTQSPYQRVLLKLSGEALASKNGMGIDASQADFIAQRVAAVCALGIEIAIVIGAGNLWRGTMGIDRGMDRSTADHMGMIGTVMNGLALQDALERTGVITRVQTAVPMNTVAEPYIRLRAMRHLEKGRVVILAGGTGNPYFTTDSAAALRAKEIGANIVIKATKVDGVYDADPKKNPNAKRYTHISYQKVLHDRLNVMDMTAFTLCQEDKMPILIVNFWDDNALIKAMQGDLSVGTLIDEHGE